MHKQAKIGWIGQPARFLPVRELPPADTIRWSPRRKAEVVLAVTGDLLTADDACRRYRMTPEELAGWITSYRSQGVKGLHRKNYRRPKGSRRTSDCGNASR